MTKRKVEKSGYRVLGSAVRRLAKLLENAVTSKTRFFQLASLQGKAHSFRCSIRLMNRKVTPPNSAIAPQMMVLICFIHAQGQFGKLLLSAWLIHNVYE
jgi:hypothetical protein